MGPPSQREATAGEQAGRRELCRLGKVCCTAAALRAWGEGAATWFEHSSERSLWSVPSPCRTGISWASHPLRSFHRIPFILADSTADVSIGLKLWGEHLPPLEPPSGFLVQFAVVHSGGDHWQTGEPSAECWVGAQAALHAARQLSAALAAAAHNPAHPITAHPCPAHPCPAHLCPCNCRLGVHVA